MNFPKQPQVGDIVLFTCNPGDDIAKSNFNKDAIPAIITRVWGPVCVNIKIIPDCGAMQDRTSVVHKSQNPAGYNWIYNDERDAITIDTNIDLMKYTSYQFLDSNSPNFQQDCQLVEGFFEGLRTKSKIQKGNWIKLSERKPEYGKRVLVKNEKGQLLTYALFLHKDIPHKGVDSDMWNTKDVIPQGYDDNSPMVEWLEEN